MAISLKAEFYHIIIVFPFFFLLLDSLRCRRTLNSNVLICALSQQTSIRANPENVYGKVGGGEVRQFMGFWIVVHQNEGFACAT